MNIYRDFVPRKEMLVIDTTLKQLEIETFTLVFSVNQSIHIKLILGPLLTGIATESF